MPLLYYIKKTLFLALFIVMQGCTGTPVSSLPNQLQVSPAQETHPDLNKLKNQIQNNKSQARKFKGLRSLIVVQNNTLLFESYFADGAKNKAVNVASLGKSLLSALIGIAIEEGNIQSESESLYRYFSYPNYNHWSIEKQRIELRHLLSMTVGWDCGNIFNYREHCGATMQEQEDPYKYILDLPMTHSPGQRFNYNDAVPQFLVAILAATTRTAPREYFREKLMQPLGLSHNLYDGNKLTSRDMLKFGLLYLYQGRWLESQLISKDWIDSSTSPQFSFGHAEEKRAYGYLWWLREFIVANQILPTFYAAGNGGQRIYVTPKLNSVVVLTGNNYGKTNLMTQPDSIMRDHILPVLMQSTKNN